MPRKKPKPALKLGDRKKTDVRCSAELMAAIDATCVQLGTTKNGLFSLGAALVVAMVAPALEKGDVAEKLRAHLVRQISELV